MQIVTHTSDYIILILINPKIALMLLTTGLGICFAICSLSNVESPLLRSSQSSGLHLAP